MTDAVGAVDRLKRIGVEEPAVSARIRRSRVSPVRAIMDDGPLCRTGTSGVVGEQSHLSRTVDVYLEVTVDAAGWRALARFAVPLVDEELEAWSFMVSFDPCFTLRLLEDEQATIEVRVEQVQLGAPLVLTAI